MLMTKGHGAATIAKMLRAKARHNYDLELEAYMRAGERWWIPLSPSDDVWDAVDGITSCSTNQDRFTSRGAMRPTRSRRTRRTTRCTATFDDLVNDAFKRQFVPKYIESPTDAHVSRLAIDDTMWIAKLVGKVLTVAANAYGECCSLMFLSTSGKFRDKQHAGELGDRASMGTNVKVVATRLPCQHVDYKGCCGATTTDANSRHAPCDIRGGQLRTTTPSCAMKSQTHSTYTTRETSSSSTSSPNGTMSGKFAGRYFGAGAQRDAVGVRDREAQSCHIRPHGQEGGRLAL